MKKAMSFCLVLLTALITIKANAETLTPLKAAELACHRLDRLVVLKKVEKTYVSKFQKLSLELLPSNDPSGAQFQVTTSQTTPAQGSPLSLTLFIDQTGKVLKHQVNEGGNAGPNVEWTGKDPVSLVEAGLHFVLDGHHSNHQLHPFAENFSYLTIDQKTSASSTVAELVLNSNTTTARLVLTLDLNGKLLKSEVVP